MNFGSPGSQVATIRDGYSLQTLPSLARRVHVACTEAKVSTASTCRSRGVLANSIPSAWFAFTTSSAASHSPGSPASSGRSASVRMYIAIATRSSSLGFISSTITPMMGLLSS